MPCTVFLFGNETMTGIITPGVSWQVQGVTPAAHLDQSCKFRHQVPTFPNQHADSGRRHWACSGVHQLSILMGGTPICHCDVPSTLSGQAVGDPQAAGYAHHPTPLRSLSERPAIPVWGSTGHHHEPRWVDIPRQSITDRHCFEQSADRSAGDVSQTYLGQPRLLAYHGPWPIR